MEDLEYLCAYGRIVIRTNSTVATDLLYFRRLFLFLFQKWICCGVKTCIYAGCLENETFFFHFAVHKFALKSVIFTFLYLIQVNSVKSGFELEL